MSQHTIAAYQIDVRWTIVQVSDAFCRMFHCTKSSLIGRDARELLRADRRQDFRHYVARALVGVGSVESTVPLVAPCGKEGWFRHALEPIIEDGVLAGYRASIVPCLAVKAEVPTRRWEWRPAAFTQVWNFDAATLAGAR